MVANKLSEDSNEVESNLSNTHLPVYPDQTLIVIGFTGPLGSGCSYISKALAEKLQFKYFKPSDIIREYINPDESDSVNVLQNMGNELREKKGPSFLIEKIFEKFQKDYQKCEGLIIDGIKNEEEVRTLRLAPNFFLFSIQADKEIRCKRLTGNGRLKTIRNLNRQI